MDSNQGFRPDWASAPGDTIEDILKERHLSVEEFAQLIGQTLEAVNVLLQGRATITIAVARRLSMVLGASVEFWMSRDFQYREDAAKLHVLDEQWLAELPVGDMIKFGWLTPVPHPSEEVAACLSFFNMPSIRAWRETYANVQEMAAFRTSNAFDSRPAAVATWLRRGEILGEAIECSPWHAQGFRGTLSHIRSLTRKKDPSL